MAAALLNANGWCITLRHDSRLLSNLATGSAPHVWAAAWSSGIDPNPFQLFHHQSTAASVRNYGIHWILNESGDEYQQRIVTDIADLIDAGRSTNDRRERSLIYRDTFDRIMDLAVELPTYNRQDMFVFNRHVIDVSTLQHSDSPFWSPLARIWEVSLVGGQA